MAGIDAVKWVSEFPVANARGEPLYTFEQATSRQDGKPRVPVGRSKLYEDAKDGYVHVTYIGSEKSTARVTQAALDAYVDEEWCDCPRCCTRRRKATVRRALGKANGHV